MTQFEEVMKALNQLISVVAGRDGAISTNYLSETPLERISELISLASRDLTDAAQTGDQKAMKQAQRKLESLGSLRVLANSLVNETEWN